MGAAMTSNPGHNTARDPRYDVLFEPIRIGPVTAKNRFYQVPHATGTGSAMPHTRAGIREAKAEGGWAVVCTGYCSIHPSSDDRHYPFSSLWNDADVKAQSVMVDAVHRHGALAGVELWHGGGVVANKVTREAPLSPSGIGEPVYVTHPIQPRVMDKADIRALLSWQKDAALRARAAGFDIVYVYAGMGYLPFQFLVSRYNKRTDEYGGSFKNRARLLHEMIEVTKEAVGDTCAIAVRLTAEENMGANGFRGEVEGEALFDLLGDLPDLWDVKLGFADDGVTSRFKDEAYHEEFVRYVKTKTAKPVVGVGRFTSPDTMVRQIRSGVLDLIGAARPSIADPFLPSKIEQGRIDEIRECIGCNVCVATYAEGVPIRCTQNPTMGEEWRRGWHPEHITAHGSDDRVLIVGAGPAGLECARALGQRGYAVTLADAERELGGRVTRESRLPGLAAWARVRDWRLGRLDTMPNVEIYRDSQLGVGDILELAPQRVVLATGARWTPCLPSGPDGVPPEIAPSVTVQTPDDIMDSETPAGDVLVLDLDPYYMGGVVAEKLARDGHAVRVVTPNTAVSPWTAFTEEQHRIMVRLLKLGVDVMTAHSLLAVNGRGAEVASIYGGKTQLLACDTLVVVGTRAPFDGLARDLEEQQDKVRDAGIKGVTTIGDAYAPGAIVHAVASGHRYARELDANDLTVRVEPTGGSYTTAGK